MASVLCFCEGNMSDNSGFDLGSDFDAGSELDLSSDFDAGAELDVSSDFDASAELDTDVSTGYDGFSSDVGVESYDTLEYSESDFDESYSDIQGDTTGFSYDSSSYDTSEYDSASEDYAEPSTTEYMDSYDTGIEGDYEGGEPSDASTDYSAGDYSTEELADEYNNDFENGLEDESAIEEPDSNLDSSDMQEETDLTGEEGFESDTEDFSDSTEEPALDEPTDAFDTETQDEAFSDETEVDTNESVEDEADSTESGEFEDDTSYEEVDEASDGLTEDIDGTEEAETETQDETYADSFETAETVDNDDVNEMTESSQDEIDNTEEIDNDEIDEDNNESEDVESEIPSEEKFESAGENDTDTTEATEDVADLTEDSGDIAEEETDETSDLEDVENSENDSSEDETLNEEDSEASETEDTTETVEDETDSSEETDDTAEEETDDETSDLEDVENSENDGSEDEALNEEDSEDNNEDDITETSEDESDSTEETDDATEDDANEETADSDGDESSENENSEDEDINKGSSEDSDEDDTAEVDEDELNSTEETADTVEDENSNESEDFDGAEDTETEDNSTESEEDLLAKDNEAENIDNNEASTDDVVNDNNDVIDRKIENNELNETLEKFDQENWDSMNIEEQKEAIRELGDAVAKDLELTNKPNIEFYNNEDDNDFGGYSAKNNTIYVNEHNMSDARETADTIAHESRHCWQHERAENPKTEQDREFKENFDDYIRPEDDYQAYRDQPVESDAREYAANICENINSKASEEGLNESNEISDGDTGNSDDMESATDSSGDTNPETIGMNETEDIFAVGNSVNEKPVSETMGNNDEVIANDTFTDNSFDNAGETNGEFDSDNITENGNEQITDHTVETGSEADSEGAREVESVNELNDSLKNFTQENWDSMSPEDQKESINNLRDAVANELGLVNSPNVDYYNNPQGNDFGGYSPDNNTIYINEYNMNDAHETADTIAHESRHCWQHERAENPQNEQDLAFRENFDDYIKPEDDYQAYRDQIVEVDAREYASNVCSRIDNPPFEESAYKAEVSKASEEKIDNTSSNDKFIEENRPDDLVSKSELNPMSEAAAKKCEEAGLSEERVVELRETPRGDKPEPSEYLSKDYIDNHLSNFEESGCYKIISNRNGEPSGDIANSSNSIFVINGKDADRLISEAGGDPRKLEKSLAMEKGYLGDNPYIIRCDNPQNLRMSTGNETNAWQNEWCPGGTTRGGVDEAIVDNIKKGDYSYRRVFSDEDWKK